MCMYVLYMYELAERTGGKHGSIRPGGGPGAASEGPHKYGQGQLTSEQACTISSGGLGAISGLEPLEVNSCLQLLEDDIYIRIPYWNP